MRFIPRIITLLIFIFSLQPAVADVVYDFFLNNGESFAPQQENVMASITVSDAAVAAGSARVSDSSVLISLTARLDNNQGVPIDLTEADLNSAGSDHQLTFSGDRLTISAFSETIPSAPQLADAWLITESLSINTGMTDVDHVAHLRAHSIFLESLASSVGGDPSLFTQSLVEGSWRRRDAVEVDIDIKPGNKRNIINPRKKGGTWVAVLSSTATVFDPLQVDIPSVRFGPEGAEALRHKVKDINKDGLGDLLLRFSVPDTGITCEDSNAILRGQTFDGDTIIGSDAITVVGCKPKKQSQSHHKKPKKGRKDMP